MSEYQEFTGKNVEEALRHARESFGVTGLEDLDFEILTPGSRGVLGMGAEPARILAAPRAALGGSAPLREAAAAIPLPPAPRPDRDRDRPPRDRGDRDRAPRDRAPEVAAPREAGASDRPAPAPARQPERREGPSRGDARPQPRADGGRPPGRRLEQPDRGQRPRREDHREGRRDERRVSGLSEREQEEVASARAPMSTEREEIQAAEASPEALAVGQEILQELIRLMGYRASVTIAGGDTSKLDVTGDEAEKEALGALIGRKGERLSALQHLVNLMLSRRMGTWTRVLVDVEDYRGRRERQLRDIAFRAAERVVETGKMLQLEPMPALERRWVHLSLKDHPAVITQSIGEEPQRRVVVLRRDV